MKIQVFRAEDFKTASWSGGTTTELFIYPHNSIFNERNFSFRLSMAKVNIENSKFTPLKGVTRKLMVLNGSIKLIHENHHSKQLIPFEIDEFEGGWNTQCEGTCEDFNLMTTGKTKGSLKARIIEKGQVDHYSIGDNMSQLFIYAYHGKISFDFESTIHNLNEGQLIAIHSDLPPYLNLKSSEDSELIIAEISL